jgi:mRNA-degrading endonuclease YafQ of YafQ-DinJ toxin-antitoxin module
MKRLELEKPFRKKSKKILSKNPSLHDIYGRLLTKLANDPFDP